MTRLNRRSVAEGFWEGLVMAGPHGKGWVDCETQRPVKPGRHLSDPAKYGEAKRLDQAREVLEDLGPGTIAFSPALLRSALFGAGDEVWHSQRNVLDGWRTLPSGFGEEYEVSGPTLSQEHGEVLFGLLQRFRGLPYGTPQKLYLSSFAEETLGWTRNDRSEMQVELALIRLSSVKIRRAWSAITQEGKQEIRLIDFELANGGCEVSLHRSFAQSFRGHLTYLHFKHLRNLRRPLSRWLFQFILASECDGARIEYQRLAVLYGTSKPLKEFGRSVRKELAFLKDINLIVRFDEHHCGVSIVKHSTLRKLGVHDF